MNYKQNSILTKNQIIGLSYFVSLLPAALIIGSFPADLIVSFSALIFLYISFINKFKFFYNNWITKIIIFFCLYLSAKSVFMQEETFSIIRSVFYIRYLLFSLLVCYLYNISPKFKKIFFRICTFTLVFLAIHAYLAHFFNFDFLKFNFETISIKQNFSIIFNEWKVPIDYRISGLFYSESILGSYLQKILPIYLAIIFINKKSLKYFIFFIFLFFLIPISGERSALALSTLFILSFILIYNSSFKKKFYIVLTFILGFILIIGMNPNLKSRIIDNTINNLTEKHTNSNLSKDDNKLNNKINLNLFSIGHQGHFKAAYLIFKDNPIFGVGIKNFRYECQKSQYKSAYSCTTHPHNTYLQLLAETGIIGFSFVFLFFIILSFSVIKMFILNLKGKIVVEEHYKCFLLSVFVNLWPIIPTGSFFNNWISICYFLSIGFLLGEIYKKEKVFQK